MGYWGTGLYSNDYALDLRSTIAALARLPVPDDELLDMLLAMENPDALKGQTTDYEVFWLTTAQQFTRKGIQSERARERAESILSEKQGELLSSWRSASFEKLRAEIASKSDKPRKTLKAPQPLLFETGEMFVFPTRKGRPPNTYFPRWEAERVWVPWDPEKPREGRFVPWEPDGWGAAVVINRGHALGYLAYYQLLTRVCAFTTKPSFEQLMSERAWAPRRSGTFPKSHYKRMKLESLGQIDLDGAKLAPLLNEERRSVSRAIQDISFLNDMDVLPAEATPEQVAAFPNQIPGLDSIMKG